MTDDKLNPVHPGKVLLEEFILPMGLSQAAVASGTRISKARIGNFVHHRGRLDAETALRLSRNFGASPQFWLGLQMDFELDICADALGDQMVSEVVRIR